MGAGAPDLDQCLKAARSIKIPCKAAYSGVLARACSELGSSVTGGSAGLACTEGRVRR